MKNSVFFIYLLILAGSTYLIRVIPFIAIKEKINNSFVRSFSILYSVCSFNRHDYSGSVLCY